MKTAQDFEKSVESEIKSFHSRMEKRKQEIVAAIAKFNELLANPKPD